MIKSLLINSSILLFGLIFLLIQGCAIPTAQTTPDFIEPLSGMEFVFVERGKFQMGDHSEKIKQELPVHEVTMPGFAIGMYEVTFTQYDEFCEATGRTKADDEGWGRGNRPVINVTWEDARAYADWLSTQTELRFSLPTEAQWEYFARAGTKGEYWTGRKLAKNRANCRECGSQWDNKSTAPVGSFRPNPWGVFDTAGNVSEWVLDDFNRGYVGAPVDGSAWLADNQSRKSQRGGAWDYPKSDLRSASRDDRRMDKKYNNAGFRLVLNRSTEEL